MDPAFRIGIIGTGLIVQESHLPACLAATGVSVAALVDTAPGRAEECAKRFGIRPEIYEHPSQLGGRVDGAIIATPDHSHAAIAIDCLERRIPVLIEKPLAPTDAECEAIRAASIRAGVPVAVGYCLRFWPSIEAVGSLMQAKTFGATLRFIMQTGSPGGWSPLSAYYLRDGGAGAMSINGSHFLERALHWFGEPTDVRYSDDSDGGPEANAEAILSYPGFEGIIRVSRTTKLNAGCAVETERGLLVHRDWLAPNVEFIPRDHCSQPFAIQGPDCSIAGRPDMYLRQVEDFVRCCRSGSTPRVGIERGMAVTRLINSLYARRERLSDDWHAKSRAVGTGR